MGAMKVIVDFDRCESNAVCMGVAPEVFEVRDDDFLYLFFPDDDPGHKLGLESLRRLEDRALSEDHIPVSLETMKAQLAVIASTGSSVWDALADVTIPVLVANGAHDRMIDAYGTFAMVGRLPNAKAILYSDAGHGFLFQHIEDFAGEVLAFLE